MRYLDNLITFAPLFLPVSVFLQPGILL